MKHKLKLWYANHQTILIITQYTLLSVFLLLITWLIDYRYISIKLYIPNLLLLSTEVSNSFLSNLSGVFLTVSTFTLTTIITVVNRYSSSFSPRVVSDFLEKPNVLSLFGIFVGGFFYTVLSLFMLQNVKLDQKVLSGTLGVVYAIAAMVSFVFFAQQLLSDIRLSNVVDHIYDKALTLISEEATARYESERYDSDDVITGINIYANKTGYLYSIDYDRLNHLLKDYHCEFVIQKKIGEYIAKGVYIGTLRLFHPMETSKEEKNQLYEHISNCFILNQARNDKEDYHHEITNLIEIAIRGIGGGVSDPNTAIACIGKVSILLGKLFSSKNHFIVKRETDTSKIVYITYSVEEELYLTFNEIIYFGKKEASIGLAMLEGLYLTYMLSDDSAKQAVTDFFKETYDICYNAVETVMDRRALKRIYDDFLQNRDQQSDKEVVRDEE